MGENIYIARQVIEKMDEALRKKADLLDVWKAVYFCVSFDFRAPAVVNPWDIRPISDKFICYEDFRKVLSNYLCAEIGRIAGEVREKGITSRPSDICNETYAVAIAGQQIGSDIFLTGICSENGPDKDQLDKILAIESTYSPVSDYLNLSERYGFFKEPPPD